MTNRVRSRTRFFRAPCPIKPNSSSKARNWRFRTRQGSLSEGRLHQRPGDRLLHPHRAGASSASERSSAHDEALPERSGSGVFLRKKLSGPSPEMGARRRKRLERRQQSQHGLLPRQRSADAGLGGEPGRSRTAHLARAQERRGAADDDGLRSRSRRAGRHRAMLPGRHLAARSC